MIPPMMVAKAGPCHLHVCWRECGCPRQHDGLKGCGLCIAVDHSSSSIANTLREQERQKQKGAAAGRHLALLYQAGATNLCSTKHGRPGFIQSQRAQLPSRPAMTRMCATDRVWIRTTDATVLEPKPRQLLGYAGCCKQRGHARAGDYGVLQSGNSSLQACCSENAGAAVPGHCTAHTGPHVSQLAREDTSMV